MIFASRAEIEVAVLDLIRQRCAIPVHGVHIIATGANPPEPNWRVGTVFIADDMELPLEAYNAISELQKTYRLM